MRSRFHLKCIYKGFCSEGRVLDNFFTTFVLLDSFIIKLRFRYYSITNILNVPDWHNPIYHILILPHSQFA